MRISKYLAFLGFIIAASSSQSLAQSTDVHVRPDSSDTLRARVRLETVEDSIFAKRGVLLPRFMRRPPAAFVASAGDKSVRVLAWGDFGTGTTSQKKVAEAMRNYHTKKPFSFGITLGDNFYPNGLTTPTNVRWQRDFEALYSPMGIKVYPVFGNHDWGNPDSPAAEITYSLYSKTWSMPSEYYTYTAGAFNGSPLVQFYAIDTNEFSEKQLLWLQTELAKSKAKWKIVYGHYPPYVASKNKDQSDNVRKVLWPMLKKGGVDAYFCGHNHSMQHLKDIDGIAVFINGGGGQGLYAIDADDPNAIFLAEEFGFLVIDIADKDITVHFVSLDGLELYSTKIDKG